MKYDGRLIDCSIIIKRKSAWRSCHSHTIKIEVDPVAIMVIFEIFATTFYVTVKDRKRPLFSHH